MRCFECHGTGVKSLYSGMTHERCKRCGGTGMIGTGTATPASHGGDGGCVEAVANLFIFVLALGVLFWFAQFLL